MAAAVPFIGLALSVVSTGLGVAGSFQQASQQRGQYTYQREIAKRNAAVAEKAANDAIERGKVSERRSRLKTADLIGLQRATLAGNGVKVDSGSALDITADTAATGEWDALTVRDNARREAENIRNTAANYTAQGNLYDAAAANQSGWNGLGDALTGVGTIAQKWYELSGVGDSSPPLYGPTDSYYTVPGTVNSTSGMFGHI